MQNNKDKVGFAEAVMQFGKHYWMANVLEAFERIAFFGIRAVLPLYLVGESAGGLGLNYSQKGIIYTVWALVQCLVPMVSGGFSDKYGYKKSILLAFGINFLGYGAMSLATNFSTMLAAAVLIGFGTAIFKPPVQGTVAKSLNEQNSGIGFGIFYWIVNIGGFLAPFVAATLRGNEQTPTWHLVFYGAMAVTALNFIITLIFFNDMEKTEEELKKLAENQSPIAVFVDTITTLVKDRSMFFFLLIISGFWLMFMQLWDLLPNFLDEWVDTRDVGAFLATYLPESLSSGMLNANGAAKPEILINIDSFTIILLVIPLSWLFGRFKMIVSLLLGMTIATIGFVGVGLTPVGVVAAFMIFIFAIGEIICSPKFSEFIGMTAPIDKKALYMGYSNIPFAIGWAVGNFLSGFLYDNFASKKLFATMYIKEHLPSIDTTEMKLPELMQTIATHIKGDEYDVTAMLWQQHDPWIIWIYLGAIGAISIIAMMIFYAKSNMRNATITSSIPASHVPKPAACDVPQIDDDNEEK